MICSILMMLCGCQRIQVQNKITVMRHEGKVYMFDMKVIDDEYISVGDLYQLLLVLDDLTTYTYSYDQQLFIYDYEQHRYVFDYSHKKLIVDCEMIDMSLEKMYFVEKNIYFPKKYIENVLLKGKMKIKFENKNAIIE